MELKPRFTNRCVRRLFESHQIDLMNLGGDVVTDPDKRLAITLAGQPDDDPEAIEDAVDAMTPGEHIELLTNALRRDLVPASIREAIARAATTTKSEG